MSRLPRLSGSDCVKALGNWPEARCVPIIRQAGLEVEEFEGLL